jgi:hypothetical protein
MPKGPRGERRPADVIGAAIEVARIATGEVEDDFGKAPKRSKGGRIGGKKRAEALSAEDRKAISKKATMARWGNEKKDDTVD